jgi:pimeloyl-ACP methyl ester carboxylesterase
MSRRSVLLVVAIAVVVIGAYGAISWLFADRLIGQTFPSDEPAPFAEYGLPEPESVTIPSDGVSLAAWYFTNPRAAGCAVVVVHGFSGSKAQVIGAAPLFWDRGCDLVAFDLPSHGASSNRLLTYGARERFDELAVIDWLQARTGLADERIGMIGWSYGAATSIQAASERPDLAFVIADASYSSLADIASVQAGSIYAGWAQVFVPGALFVSGLRGGFDPSEASPERAVEGLATPVLLIHSTTDGFTPYQHSEAIFAAADPETTRLELTAWGAPHAMSYPTDPVAYTGIVDAFLDALVPGFGERVTPGG